MAGVSRSGRKALRRLRTGAAVLCLKPLELGPLAAVSADGLLSLIDLQQCRLLGNLTLPLPEGFLPTAIDIAPKGHLCIAADGKRGEAELCNVKQKRPLFRVGAHRGGVSRVMIDPLGRYAVTAGEDGRVAAWELRSGQRAFNLPAHSDGVLALALNAEGSLAATGGYDRIVQLSQPGSARPPLILRSHATAVTALGFVAGERLLSGDRSGGIALWDTMQGKLLQRLEPVSAEVTAFCCNAEGTLLLAGSANGRVALYDLEGQECIAARYLEFEGAVTALVLSPEGRLAAGTASGEIGCFDLYGERRPLEEALARRDYDAIYRTARGNPAVRFSPPFRAMEAEWERVVARVDTLITADRTEGAEALLLPFEGIGAKRRKIAAIRRGLQEYGVFKTHVENGRYAVAYDLAFKFPSFRTSGVFLAMESEWERRYKRASRLLCDSATEEEGNTLLAPFRGISEKTAAIRDVIETGRRYRYFKYLIARHDWKRAWEIVRHHPELEQSDAYRSMLDVGDALFATAQRAFAAGNYKNGEAACETLLAFPDYKEEALALLQRSRT